MIPPCRIRPCRSARASSSSAAASSAARSPITWRTWAGRTSCCSSATASRRGTTWHAAGLIVTFGSTSETSTEMRKYTRDLYARLEAETGQSTGFKPVGFIEIATDADRLEEYRRVSAFNRYCGVDVHEISPAQRCGALSARAHRRHPRRLLREGGRPRQSGRRHDGAREGRAAAGRDDHRGRARSPTSLQEARRGTGVRTTQGDIEAEVRRQLRRHVGAPARRATPA